jgi:hypothetical protein
MTELARKNRLKPGAADRHKTYAKDWAKRNAERVKALRKATYEKDRQINIDKARVWKKRNPAKALACHYQSRQEPCFAQSVGREKPDGGVSRISGVKPKGTRWQQWLRTAYRTIMIALPPYAGGDTSYPVGQTAMLPTR